MGTTVFVIIVLILGALYEAGKEKNNKLNKQKSNEVNKTSNTNSKVEITTESLRQDMEDRWDRDMQRQKRKLHSAQSLKRTAL